MRITFLMAGLLSLALAWFGPLPVRAAHAFSAHMTLHVAVIAIAAPLLSLALAGSRVDPVSRWPRLFSPIPVSLLELVVVWAWHAPLLHHAARTSGALFALEQGSFLATGMLVWLAAFGGTTQQQRQRALAAVTSLLLTAMHMTLLGVLLALAGRPLYSHVLAPDVQQGGVIMLLVGGATYLAGALYRVHGILKERRDALTPD